MSKYFDTSLFDTVSDEDYDELERRLSQKSEADMAVEKLKETGDIYEFKQTAGFEEYGANMEAMDGTAPVQEANMNGFDVKSILGLTDKEVELTYSHNIFEHYMIDSEIYSDLVDQSPLMQNTLKTGKSKLPTFDYMHEDMFMSLYKYSPKAIPNERLHPSAKVNAKILGNLVNTPEFFGLRRECRLDAFNSALGTEVLGQKAITIISEMIEQNKDLKQKMQEMLSAEQAYDQMEQNMQAMGGMPGAQDPNAQQGQQGQQGQQMPGGGGGQGNMTKEEMQKLANMIAEKRKELDEQLKKSLNSKTQQQIEKKLTQACKEVTDELREVNNLCNAWGLGAGSDTMVPFQQKKDAIEHIRRSDKLKEISKLLGRMKETAIVEQKKKAKNGAVEIKSVTVGSKIEDVMPSERMNMTRDVTKRDFMRRMSENQLLTYDKQSSKEKNKGPVIVCIDTSGSMNSYRERWSKAIAIAMLEIAQLQKRDYACIIYSGRADDPIIINKNEVAPNKIIDIAERFHGGGTDFEGPLNKSCKLIESSAFKQADILFITDGECSVSDDFMKKFNHIKEEKEFKVHGVIVNENSTRYNTDSSTLTMFCDKITSVSELKKANSEANKEIFASV